MAGALLVPVSVSAKVVKQPTPVPALGGSPFNRDTTLETGIHVHWALPDALTRARMLPHDKTNRVLFPCVPDLWVLVRLNPVPASLPPKFKRTWRAWVINSRTESTSPLEQWTASTTSGVSDVHTVPGLLASAATLGQAGWGLWPSNRTDFDPAVAAYYPTSRKRFGFHDPLTDLPGGGKVSYVVIGWYSSREHDPLYNASDREALLRHWKLARHARSNRIEELHALVPLQAPASTASWRPATVTQSQVQNPPAARLQDLTRQVTRGGSHRDHTTRVRRLEQSFPPPSAQVEGGVVQVVIDAVGKQGGPSEIICHGAVVEVPLSGLPAAAGAITNEQVRLYPTTNRAMAVIAGIQQTGEDVEFVEMMLDSLDYQNSNVASVLDLPGAAHSRTFQSMPGKSRFYARIDIVPKPSLPIMSQHFVNDVQVSPTGRHIAGHWPPPVHGRSARVKPSKTVEMIKPAVRQEVKPAAPTGPTDAEISHWISETRSAFHMAETAAAASGHPLDPRLVRVQDYRKHAQPVALGHFIGGSGPNNAGWWIDIDDDAAMRELYVGAVGAVLHKPDAENLYEMPGPRWYRPWAPQVVLLDAGRSYRFGEDGVFDSQGFLRCRFSAEVLTAIGAGQTKTVNGREALANGTPLSATAGLPGEVRTLVEEALLLDSDSGSVLATHVVGAAAPTGAFQSAIRGLWLGRDPALSAAERQALKAIKTVGDVPSPIATTPWKDPIDPLFVDVNYAHPRLPLQTHWSLHANDVENTLKTGAPPPAQVTVHNERSRVTSTIAKVLDSALVTKVTIDPYGNVVNANTSPKGVSDQTFKKLDILSAPLTAFDTQLFGQGLRERSGSLRLNRLEIVDVFGMARKWSSGVADDSPAGDGNMPFWTQLTPRLPFWSRLLYRLQSAGNINEEASPLAPAICGFFLPDFVEHSLEVFDGEGHAIGQLVSDRPQSGSTQAKTLNVTFDVHPWVATSGDPLSAIANPVLRSVVAGLVAQTTDVPASQPSGKWFESGLTAFLRVIDTIRGTLDPTKKIHDSKIRLLGEPIVVLATRLKLEATAAPDASTLKGDPPPLGSAPPAPTVHLRIGDATRPDDGVLGCFLPGPSTAQSRFAPVSKEAAEKAILNGLTQGIAVAATTPVTHPFVQGLASEFDINVGETRDLIVLMDTRGGVYVTCGVLPRKKITLPREQLDAGLRNIEATFRTAPVLGLPDKNALKAAAPAIDIQGYKTRFVRREPETNLFKETRVPETAPVAELPLGRCTLTEGWMRLVVSDEGE